MLSRYDQQLSKYGSWRFVKGGGGNTVERKS